MLRKLILLCVLFLSLFGTVNICTGQNYIDDYTKAEMVKDTLIFVVDYDTTGSTRYTRKVYWLDLKNNVLSAVGGTDSTWVTADGDTIRSQKAFYAITAGGDTVFIANASGVQAKNYPRTSFFDPMACFTSDVGGMAAIRDTLSGMEEVYTFPDTSSSLVDVYLRISMEKFQINQIDSIGLVLSVNDANGDSVAFEVDSFQRTVGDTATSALTGSAASTGTFHYEFTQGANKLEEMVVYDTEFASNFVKTSEFIWIRFSRNNTFSNNVAAFVRLHGIRVYYQ